MVTHFGKYFEYEKKALYKYNWFIVLFIIISIITIIIVVVVI